MRSIYGVLGPLALTLASVIAGYAAASTSDSLVEPAGVSFTLSEAEGNDVVMLADGSVVIAGRFTATHGLPRGSITRLQPDGSVATDWVVTCDGQDLGDYFAACSIVQVDLGPDGWIYFAGDFSRINGVPRNGLARVRLTDAVLDAEWNPIPSEEPRAENFVLLEDGIIVRGKKYSLLGAGSHLPQFDPPPNLAIIRADASLLMITGTLDQQNLVRINQTTGAIDPNWSAGIEVTQWYGRNHDSPYVVGRTGSSADQPFGRLVQVDTRTNPGHRPGWTPPPELFGGDDRSFGLDGLLHLMKSSDPDQPGSPLMLVSVTLGQTAQVVREAMLPSAPTCRGGVMGVDAAGAAYLSLAPCYSETPQWSGDGSNIGKMLPDGRIDQAWKSGIHNFGLIHAAERAHDGSIVVAGTFDRVNGLPRRGLARLTPELQVDDWAPQHEGRSIRAVTTDSQGDIYAATQWRGQFERVGLFKFSGISGNLEISWNPSGLAGANGGAIETLLADRENGVIYASFPSSQFQICGAVRNRLVKLTAGATCVADPSFQPSPDDHPRSMILEGNHLYVAGGFSRIGGQPIASAARLTPTGEVDLGWQPFGAVPWQSAFVWDLTSTSGGVVLGGSFSAVRGTPRPGLARFDIASGALDVEWSNLGPWAVGLAVGRLGEDVLIMRLDDNAPGKVGTISLAQTANDGGADPSWQALDIGALPPDGVNIVFLALDDNSTLALGSFNRLGNSLTGNSAILYRVAPLVFEDGFEQP